MDMMYEMIGDFQKPMTKLKIIVKMCLNLLRDKLAIIDDNDVLIYDYTKFSEKYCCKTENESFNELYKIYKNPKFIKFVYENIDPPISDLSYVIDVSNSIRTHLYEKVFTPFNIYVISNKHKHKIRVV